MSKKNRIEQPYGYREQNKYVSGPAMICDAIKGKVTLEDLAEHIRELMLRSLVDVRYARDMESFVFSNYDGMDVAFAKLYDVFVSDLVNECYYEPETKKIIIEFENGDKLRLPVDEVITLIEKESHDRMVDVKSLWDAIGIEQESRKSILELIEEEAKVREEADNEILRKIGKLVDSEATITDLIEKEKTEREEADKEFEEKIEQEKAAREEYDKELEGKIEEEINARSEADKELGDKIEEEKSAREESDKELEEKLDAETERAKSVEDELKESIESSISGIEDEKTAREDADKELEGKIEEEADKRELADNEIRKALETETNDRNKVEQDIWAAIETEVNNRTSVESNIWSSINGETERAQKVESSIWTAIETEANNRTSNVSDLWNGINGEVDRATESENSIWDAIKAEIEDRKNDDEEIKSAASKLNIAKVDVQNSNVKEAFALLNADGEQLGETINVYKDSSLKNVELIGSVGDTGGQYLEFTYILDDGSEKVELLDVSSFLVESEFKDGLKVNDRGEVSVLIDDTSEKYITVTEHGIKISGVSIIASDLEGEKLTRETRDSELDTKITEETLKRQNSEKIIKKKFEDLYTELTETKNDLETEEQTRENKDSEIDGRLDVIESEGLSLKNRLGTLENDVELEKINRTEAEKELDDKISKKANSDDVYTKTESDDKFATKEEIPTDFYGKEYLDGKLSEVTAALEAEAQNRETEDSTLNGIIADEIRNRTEADETMASEIAKKVESIITDDLALSVEQNGNSVDISLNLSKEDGQMVKMKTDGIYVSSSLKYDDEHNILTFKRSGNDDEIINLKSRFKIEKIYYQREDETVIVEYSVNGQRMDDVMFKVSSIISEWRCSEKTDGAIKLTKTRETGFDQDTLYGEVLVSETHDDNALVIDGNALYVSKKSLTGELYDKSTELDLKIDSKYAELDGKVDVKASEIGDRIRDEVNTLNVRIGSEVDTLSTENLKLKSEIDDLKSENLKLNTELMKLSDKLEELEARLDTMMSIPDVSDINNMILSDKDSGYYD